MASIQTTTAITTTITAATKTAMVMMSPSTSLCQMKDHLQLHRTTLQVLKIPSIQDGVKYGVATKTSATSLAFGVKQKWIYGANQLGCFDH